MATRDMKHAAAIMRRGGVIAYPTEGCFGLGCDPRDRRAVQRILLLKNRPMSAGLILVGASLEHIQPYINASASLLEGPLATWPGPHTWILPASRRAPSWITGGRDSIAVRVTAMASVRLLCRFFGGAIVSTSANPHHQPPARSVRQVEFYFGGKLDGVVRGMTGGLSRPSEIRDAATGEVIRPGSFTVPDPVREEDS
jgi:L-threonylcarbamoyladenylate synthase